MTRVAPIPTEVRAVKAKRPPRGRETLNDRSVRSKKPAEKGKRDLYHDALVPGMALRVTDTGHKSYVLITRYPLNPQHPTPRTLGECYLPSEGTAEVDEPTKVQSGALTLAEARDKARAWIDLIQRGIDPKIEEERQRAAELRKQNHSFEAIATAFLERHVKGPAYLQLEAQAEALMAAPENKKMQKGAAIRKVSALPENKAHVEAAKNQGITKKLEADRILKQEFIARWAIRPVVDIMPEEVSAAIRAIVDRGSPYQAHNAYGYLSNMYSWAIASGEYGLTSSPLDHLKPGRLIGPKESRKRVLNDEEIRLVWAAAAGMGYPYGPVIQLLILTGQREMEIGGMSWSEFDSSKNILTIPWTRMKNRLTHEVPICPKALGILNDLPRWKGDFAFSATGGRSAINGFSKPKVTIDQEIAKARAEARTGKKDAMLKQVDYLPSWTFQDLRRTVRTNFSALPIQEEVKELIISHIKKGLKAVYDLHAFREEKRQGLLLWEDRLAGILQPKVDQS